MHPQVVYYHSGVGSSSWNLSDQIFGGGLASGLSENIREGYAFLVNNFVEYKDGTDEIFLVGFSRGAFTARSIGGMICSIGLLKKEAMTHFYDIFDDFENAGEKGYVPKLPVSDKGNFHFTASPDTKTYLSGYKKALLAVSSPHEKRV
jgi:hypothetical protein